MKRAAAYIRVSTPGQVKFGYSIGEQERRAWEYIERQGYLLAETVYDAGESGEIEARPGLLRIRELARSRACDLVVAIKLDRLGRDALIILQALDYIRSYGVSVEYVDLQIDTSTAIGRYIEVSMAGLAGLELDMIRQRMMSGKIGKATSGRLPVNIRGLGYRTISVAEARALPEYAGRDGMIEWIPAEVELVQEIFRRYAAGEATQRGLAVELNARGLTTARGRPFSQCAVRDILLNPIYRGELRWPNRFIRMVRDPETRSKRRVITPARPEEQVRIEFPGVIDAVVWEQTQARMAQNLAQLSGRPSATIVPLVGALYCALCKGRAGYPLRLSYVTAPPPSAGREKYQYYACQSRTRLGMSPCGVSARVETLDAAAYRFVLASFQPGVLGPLARARAEEARRADGNLEAECQRLRQGLAELTEQEGRFADLILAGISRQVVEGRVRELQGKRLQLDDALRAAEARLATRQDPADAARIAEDTAAEWRAEFLAARDDPARLRRAYQRCLRGYLSPSGSVRWELLWG